jgi:hypothetical protein
LPLGPEELDKSRYDDQTRIRDQFRNLTHTADIFNPIRIGKAQILVQAMAHIVPIQQEGVTVHAHKPRFNRIRNRGFSGSR